MSIIQIGSLEIFKQNRYYPTDIGLVSDVDLTTTK